MKRQREKKNKGDNFANDSRLPEQREYIGMLEMTWRGGYVVTNHKQLRADVFVPDHLLNGAMGGQKVMVRLLNWKRYKNYPEGEIIDVLGEAGDNDTEMHSILAEFGLPYLYPEDAVNQAEEISAEISTQEILRRKDMRGVSTFTIDPTDAKDFDDALSFQTVEVDDEQLFEVGVHIADVTHYVQPGTRLDCEAYERATSVYLVDRVIPMLPERLSNGICSLRPHEDKLCFSVIFLLDNDAKVRKYTIKRTIIRSDRRFTYDEAQERIETGKGDFATELLQLHYLAQVLRKRRMEAGAVAFEREEVGFNVDENGKPLSVFFRVQKEANQLIEEFMLLANRTVAEEIGAKNNRQKTKSKEETKTFVYRVHDLPDPDRMEEFGRFVATLGYRLDLSARNTTAHSLNRLLGEVKGSTQADIIQLLAVRSMAKAVYSTDNIGHYGLAFSHYTHFTSPIRRYPDMMVHRLLWQYMKGKVSIDKEETEHQCKHCSEKEQLAAMAERTSIKYKQVEFMEQSVGNVFDAIVSSITDWGVYVEVEENKSEGLVHISSINERYSDYFLYDKQTMSLEGAGSGRRIHFGDRLRVRLIGANIEKRQLDFEIV